MIVNKPVHYRSCRRRKGESEGPKFDITPYKNLTENFNLLDIGFGDGESIVNLKKQNKINIFGVDDYHIGFNKLMDIKYKKNMNNVFLIRGDIVEIIDTFPDKFFNKVHIFFPDPWPKKKHHKRRFLNEYFLEKLKKKLKKNNLIHFTSDHMNFFLDTKKLISKYINNDVEFFPNRSHRPITKFEQKALDKKNMIFDMLFKL